MFSHIFHGVTPSEMAVRPPKKAAYMACHFSSGGPGLSNLPQFLPPSSILLLDDSMPPGEHDPALCARQLQDLAERHKPKAIILDFQNPPGNASRRMVNALLQALPCTVAVTDSYAKVAGCPVFLSPTPLNMALQTHLAPWLKQGVFLEVAPQAQVITVTEHASTHVPVPFDSVSGLPLEDRRLFCHYNVTVSPTQAQFTLCRTGSDIVALAKCAYDLGVREVIGLHQELSKL